jgi:phosphate transport system protein
MLEEKIVGLKKRLVEYAGIVENMIDKSINGLVHKDEGLLNEVINDFEPQVNDLENEIDEMCVNIIAQYAPKGRDLRIILMALKINKDFERIGDHAVNIAQSGFYLIERPFLKPFLDIPKMSETTRKMFSDSITSFVNEDPVLAQNVCERDGQVDGYNLSIVKELISLANSEITAVERALHIIRISHNLERIADLSTNISEDVVYLSLGKVIKHHKGEDNGYPAGSV